MKKTYYLKDGLVHDLSGQPIKEPSILIDGDVVVKIGEYDIVKTYFDVFLRGVSAKGVYLISFDESFSAKDIAYIFRRCWEYTATGFTQKLGEMWGTKEFISWFKSEQERVPLEV